MTGNQLLGVGLWLAVCLGSREVQAQPAPAGAVVKKAPPTAKKRPDLTADVFALNGTDVESAARAADVLATFDVPAAHEALLDALALGLHPAVAVPAISALAAHPLPADIPSIKRYAGHHNPTVRAGAVTALAAYSDPAARFVIVAGLRDPAGLVRNAAAGAAARARVREAIDPMLLLLAKGEESSARSLAQLADPELARRIAEHLGKVPDAALAQCLGLILKRADFGPDTARVEVVRAIGKIQDASAVAALTDYLDATPKTPPRPSRQEAEGIVDARLGGGK